MFLLPSTPARIDKEVLKFCKSVSVSEPFYIKVEVDKEMSSEVNDCFFNVEKVVKEQGGEIQYGWQIWKTGNYFSVGL